MLGETDLPRRGLGRLASPFGRLANPLAGKELLARMRGPRTFVVATLLLLPLAAVAGGLYAMVAAAPAGDSMTSAPVGKLFFAAVTAVELGLICLLAPALTADLISGERERQTLDLLLVTPLSRRQIVVGKLVAALGSLLLLIVLALPIQAIAVLIGGIGLEELLAGLWLLTLTAVTYGCVGLCWSARMRSTRAALLLSYVTTLIGVGALPLALALAVMANGIFGYRLDQTLWPVVWLVGGPQSSPVSSLGRSLGSQSEAVLQLEALAGLLIVATNPLLTGIASAAGLTQGRPLAAWESVGNTYELPYVAPWLVFGVLHVLMTLVLIWLTARSLGRTRR